MGIDMLNGLEQIAASSPPASPAVQLDLSYTSPEAPLLESLAAAQSVAPVQGSGDQVDISNEAQQMSGQAEADEAAREAREVYDASIDEERAEDLQQELLRVNQEVAAAQAELEELQRKAEEDATMLAAMNLKQAELRDLQQQMADLQRRVFV